VNASSPPFFGSLSSELYPFFHLYSLVHCFFHRCLEPNNQLHQSQGFRISIMPPRTCARHPSHYLDPRDNAASDSRLFTTNCRYNWPKTLTMMLIFPHAIVVSHSYAARPVTQAQRLNNIGAAKILANGLMAVESTSFPEGESITLTRMLFIDLSHSKPSHSKQQRKPRPTLKEQRNKRSSSYRHRNQHT
jgi:hypothetical protein